MQKLCRLLTLVVAFAVAFGPAWAMAAPMKFQAASLHAASPTDDDAAPVEMARTGGCQLCEGPQDTMPACVALCLTAAAWADPALAWAPLPGRSYGSLVRQVLAEIGIRPEPHPPKSILLT